MQEKITYHIDIISDKPSGYFVKVRELRGCMTQGETVPEALINIADALMVYTQSCVNHNEISNLRVVRKKCRR